MCQGNSGRMWNAASEEDHLGMAGENAPHRITAQINGELYKTLSRVPTTWLLLLKNNKIIPKMHIWKLHGLLKEIHLMK